MSEHTDTDFGSLAALTFSQIKSTREEMQEHFNKEDPNIEHVKDLLLNIRSQSADFSAFVEEHLKVTKEGPHRQNFVEWYQSALPCINDYQREAHDWLKIRRTSRNDDCNSIHSCSKKSRISDDGSNISGASSHALRCKFIEKKALLEAQMKGSKKRMELELEILNKQFELKKHADQVELEATNNVLKELDAMENLQLHGNERTKPTVENNFPQSQISGNPSFRSAVKEIKVPLPSASQGIHATASASSIDERSRGSQPKIEASKGPCTYADCPLPKVEPPVFSGEDPSQFITFQRRFSLLIESRPLSPSAKFQYLIMYTSGVALRIVSSFDQADPEIAFNQAWQQLSYDYGSDLALEQVYVQKLHDWPAMKREDPEGLRELRIFLHSMLNKLNGRIFLERWTSGMEVKKLVMKLPRSMRERYRPSFVEALRTERLSLKHFTDFVTKEERELNTPGGLANFMDETSTDLEPRHNFRPPKEGGKNRSLKTRTEIKATHVCTFCAQAHILAECSKFAKEPIEKRRNFVKTKELCFACTKPHHRADQCNHPRRCKRCNRNHPTCMHFEKEFSSHRQDLSDSEEDEASSTTDSSSVT